MGEYGIEELGLSRIISDSYELLDLQSFFTVGEDEVRAWTVRSRSNQRRKQRERSIRTC